MDLIAEQDVTLEVHASEVIYEENSVRARIKKELNKMKQQVESNEKATELEGVIALSKTLLALSRTRIAYQNARTILKEKRELLARFHSNAVISDVQLEVDRAMIDIVSFVSMPSLQKKLKEGTLSREKMTNIAKAVRDACNVENLSDEEKKRFEDECNTTVRNIASEMGRTDLVTSLNKISNREGQFTSIADINVLPDIEISKTQ